MVYNKEYTQCCALNNINHGIQLTIYTMLYSKKYKYVVQKTIYAVFTTNNIYNVVQ